MKKLLTILIMLISIIPAFAADADSGESTVGKSLASDSFTVKGYKVKANGELEFVVVDSINESLNTFDNEGGTGDQNYVDLTNHLESLLGTVSRSNDISQEGAISTSAANLIFSYRLSGSDNGQYDISFIVDGFGGSDEDNSDVAIDAMYEMSNLNFVFTNTKDNSNRRGNYSNTGRTVVHSVSVIDGSGTPSDRTLRQPLNIENASSGDYWIFRGAVFLAISKEDFESAKLGNYSTTVTAVLTTNG